MSHERQSPIVGAPGRTTGAKPVGQSCSSDEPIAEPAQPATDVDTASRRKSGRLPVDTFSDSAIQRERALRGVALRRAKREAKERAEELNRLTLATRAGIVLARELTADEIGTIVRALLDRLRAGQDVTRSAAELRRWLVLGAGLPAEEEPDDAIDPSKWTDAQRQARRAVLLRMADEEARDKEAAASELSDGRSDQGV